MERLTDDTLGFIEKQSKLFLNKFTKEDGLTIDKLSTFMHVDRSKASRILNNMFKKKLIVKINIRPVIFVMVSDYLKNEIDNEYSSVEQFKIDFIQLKKNAVFKKVVGNERGLKKPIDQIKAALKYPKGGLPLIIFGESGTGKSYLIKTAFEYAKAANILDKDAPFITVNCAQYADNPELLSSILFGYTKGAFTGANTNKVGVIEQANKGILFLDEVHRLNPEGQEKLFGYMDNGFFSPIGADEKKIYSSARLMFATTMQDKFFLETFMRRVPIAIEMPTLEKRGLIEKKQMINLFFEKESKEIQKKIKVSSNALNRLYRYHYKANVGEVENEIKSLIALVYSKEEKSISEISIRARDLPVKFLNQKINDTYPITQTVTFNYKKQNDSNTNESLPINNQIEKAWQYIQKLSQEQVVERDKYEYVVNNIMKYIYFSMIEQDNVVFKYLLTDLRNILKIMHYGEEFYNNENLVYKMAAYIYYMLSFPKYIRIKIERKNNIKYIFSNEYSFIKKLKKNIEQKFEINVKESDMIWLAILIAEEDLPIDATPAIIMAHGYATASSIADTCNGILRHPVFQSIDMLPSATIEDIVNSLHDYTEKIQSRQGIIILLDMGSLSQAVEKVQHFFPYPILMVDKVSTPMALEVGNCILQKNSFTEIKKRIKNFHPENSLFTPRKNIRNVVITTCMTGIGTAEQLRKLLTESFKGIIPIDVVSVEFYDIRKQLKKYKNEGTNVLAIIGVDDPQIDEIKYIPIEDIISGEKNGRLRNILKQVSSTKNIKIAEQKMVKNFSLTRVMESLTILSVDKVMNVIDAFFNALEEKINYKLQNKNKIILYVHIASMIERVIRGNGLEVYQGNNDLINRDSTFSVLKESISVIEDKFIISISDAELAYIRELVID